MRIIFSIIALFSLCGILAQPYTPSQGRERPRSRTIAYPSAQEASAADGGDNRYFTRISEWTRRGDTLAVTFTVPFAWANRQKIFHIEAASSNFEVRVNGRSVGYDADGNTPSEFNISRYTREGRNTLELVLANPSSAAPLESWKRSYEPAVGQAWITCQPTMRIRDVLVRTWQSEDDAREAVAEVGIVVKLDALNSRTSRIHYELLTPAGETAQKGFKEVTLDMGREDTVRFLARIPTNLLWSAELPTRYTLRLSTQHEGRHAEFLELLVGFRILEMKQGRLFVNGEPVALRVAEVDTQRIEDNDVARLCEQGYNTLRLAPGPVAAGFLDRCDEQGVYVIVQAPVDTSSSGDSRSKGGNPSNDPAWRGAFVERAEDIYHTSKRHPSVIAFSLARNSANGIGLYESYLALKRWNDPRPVIYPEAGGEWNSDALETN